MQEAPLGLGSDSEGQLCWAWASRPAGLLLFFLHLKSTLSYTGYFLMFQEAGGPVIYSFPITEYWWKGNFIIKLKDKKYKPPFYSVIYPFL